MCIEDAIKGVCGFQPKIKVDIEVDLPQPGGITPGSTNVCEKNHDYGMPMPLDGLPMPLDGLMGLIKQIVGCEELPRMPEPEMPPRGPEERSQPFKPKDPNNYSSESSEEDKESEEKKNPFRKDR